MGHFLKTMLLMPSFYGLGSWIITLFFLNQEIIYILPISEAGAVLYVFVIFIFMLSAFLFYDKSSQIVLSGLSFEFKTFDFVNFSIFSIIGIFGLILYLYDFSAVFGGISNLITIIIDSPLVLRAAQPDNISYGVQISYFSWCSIFFGILIVELSSYNRKLKFFVIVLVFTEFVLNLAFIDRTRPIWIFIVCVLGYYFSRGAKNSKIGTLLFYLIVVPFSIFIVFAIFSGKFDSQKGVFNNLMIYLLGGYGYMDALLNEKIELMYFPARMFYPVSKVLEYLDISGAAPNQILDFKAVPFFTNVGTFLEPIYSDGGVLYLILGVPLIVFGTDYLALRAFKSRSIIGLFVWSNFVFISMMSFFVPKFNSTNIYLFYALYLLDQIILHQKKRRTAMA